MNITYPEMVRTSEQFFKFWLQEPDIDKFTETLTSDFSIESVLESAGTHENFENDRITFLNELRFKHFGNIVKNDDGTYAIKDNAFEFSESGPNQIHWRITTTQLRKGDGDLEKGRHWYQMAATGLATFAKEDDTVKIKHIKQKYNKIIVVREPIKRSR